MSILIMGKEGFGGRNLTELFTKSRYSILAPSKLDVNTARQDFYLDYVKEPHHNNI